MNTFERFAEEASTERLQDMWARVLAGEIRRPQSFSLQTLRFVAELDQEIAELFEKHASGVLNADFIPDPPTEGNEFTELIRLQEFGLVSGAGGMLSKTVKLHPGPAAVRYKSHSVLLFINKDVKLEIKCVLLTRVGRQIYKIIEPAPDIEHARAFAKKIRKDCIDRILYVPTSGEGSPASQSIELWVKPPDPFNDSASEPQKPSE